MPVSTKLQRGGSITAPSDEQPEFVTAGATGGPRNRPEACALWSRGKTERTAWAMCEAGSRNRQASNSQRQ
jgi:hypothetical protein